MSDNHSGNIMENIRRRIFSKILTPSNFKEFIKNDIINENSTWLSSYYDDKEIWIEKFDIETSEEYISVALAVMQALKYNKNLNDHFKIVSTLIHGRCFFIDDIEQYEYHIKEKKLLKMILDFIYNNNTVNMYERDQLHMKPGSIAEIMLFLMKSENFIDIHNLFSQPLFRGEQVFLLLAMFFSPDMMKINEVSHLVPFIELYNNLSLSLGFTCGSMIPFVFKQFFSRFNYKLEDIPDAPENFIRNQYFHIMINSFFNLNNPVQQIIEELRPLTKFFKIYFIYDKEINVTTEPRYIVGIKKPGTWEFSKSAAIIINQFQKEISTNELVSVYKLQTCFLHIIDHEFAKVTRPHLGARSQEPWGTCPGAEEVEKDMIYTYVRSLNIDLKSFTYFNIHSDLSDMNIIDLRRFNEVPVENPTREIRFGEVSIENTQITVIFTAKETYDSHQNAHYNIRGIHLDRKFLYKQWNACRELEKNDIHSFKEFKKRHFGGTDIQEPVDDESIVNILESRENTLYKKQESSLLKMGKWIEIKHMLENKIPKSKFDHLEKLYFSNLTTVQKQNAIKRYINNNLKNDDITDEDFQHINAIIREDLISQMDIYTSEVKTVSLESLSDVMNLTKHYGVSRKRSYSSIVSQMNSLHTDDNPPKKSKEHLRIDTDLRKLDNHSKLKIVLYSNMLDNISEELIEVVENIEKCSSTLKEEFPFINQDEDEVDISEEVTTATEETIDISVETTDLDKPTEETNEDIEIIDDTDGIEIIDITQEEIDITKEKIETLGEIIKKEMTENEIKTVNDMIQDDIKESSKVLFKDINQHLKEIHKKIVANMKPSEDILTFSSSSSSSPSMPSSPTSPTMSPMLPVTPLGKDKEMDNLNIIN